MAKKQVQQDPVLIKERKRRKFFALPWSFTTYSITTKKLIYKTGFFSSYEDEILLYRVQDISVKRSLGQKLFGLGTIIVNSQDKTCPELEIKNIKHCNEFRNILSAAPKFSTATEISVTISRVEFFHRSVIFKQPSAASFAFRKRLRTAVSFGRQ